MQLMEINIYFFLFYEFLNSIFYSIRAPIEHLLPEANAFLNRPSNPALRAAMWVPLKGDCREFILHLFVVSAVIDREPV